MTICSYCRDTGYRTEGMAIGVPVRPAEGADAVIEWVASVAACSHPKTSADGPSETDEHRATQVGLVGLVGRPAADRGASAHGGGPATGGERT